MNEIEWTEGGTVREFLFVDGIAGGVTVSISLNEHGDYAYARHDMEDKTSITGKFHAVNGADAEQLRAVLIQDVKQIAAIVNAYRATEGV